MPHPITSGRKPADAAGVLQRKLFECQFKELDDTGTFHVYAAVFNNVDRQDDVIEPGAFKDLETFVRDGWGALNHVHTDLPVAWIESAAQDDHGLVVTGRFHSTPEAQACRTVIRERMAAGKAVKCSIGYLIDDAVVETRDGKTIRVLKSLTVFEFSFVNLPANPEAEVLSAKAFSLESLGLEDAMSAERGVVEALKSALGLRVKGGRKMSGATLEKMKSFCKTMKDHGDKCMSHARDMQDKCKALKAMGEDHCKAAGELASFLKEFEGPKPREDEDYEENDDDDQVDEEEEDDDGAAKGKNEEGPEDTADGDPPKGRKKRMTDEDVARRLYRDQLKSRAIIGRNMTACP